jgi:hypothetical protein
MDKQGGLTASWVHTGLAHFFLPSLATQPWDILLIKRGGPLETGSGALKGPTLRAWADTEHRVSQGKMVWLLGKIDDGCEEIREHWRRPSCETASQKILFRDLIEHEILPEPRFGSSIYVDLVDTV